MTNPELDPRPYDTIWEADGRRQDAQRGRDDRFPDHSAGNLPMPRGSAWPWVLLALGVVALALAVSL